MKAGHIDGGKWQSFESVQLNKLEEVKAKY